MNGAESAARLTRREGLVLGAALLASLGCVAFLRTRGLFPTGFFATDSGVTGTPFHLQLAALAAGVAALQIAPVRWSRAIVCVEGALCLLLVGPALGLAFLAVLTLYYFALEIPLPRGIRLAVPIAWILGFGLVTARSLSPAVVFQGFLFSLMFHLRMLVYAWEKWQSGYPRGRMGDYWLYMLSGPLIVFPPYIGIVPFFGKNAERFEPRLDRARASSGVRHLAVGLLFALVLEGMRRTNLWATGQGIFIMDYPWSRRCWTLAAEVIAAAQLIHVVYGLLLLHGFIDRLPIDRPLLSRTYAEFWRRFQIHQKDLQVAFFFNPVMLKLRRRNRYLAIAAAAAVTMLIGNFCLHYLVRYVYYWPIFRNRVWAWVMFDVASFLGLTANLWAAEWRGRHPRPAPTPGSGVLWGILSWGLTMTFVAYLWSL